MTATGSPWTDKDVGQAVSLLHDHGCTKRVEIARAVLDALAPRVAELQRAAKVEALREAAMVAGFEQRTYTWLMTRADAIERGEGD